MEKETQSKQAKNKRRTKKRKKEMNQKQTKPKTTIKANQRYKQLGLSKTKQLWDEINSITLTNDMHL